MMVLLLWQPVTGRAESDVRTQAAHVALCVACTSVITAAFAQHTIIYTFMIVHVRVADIHNGQALWCYMYCSLYVNNNVHASLRLHHVDVF